MNINTSDVQFLFVHLETTLVDKSTTAPPSHIRRAAGVLAKVAQLIGAPTTFVLTTHDRTALAPELEPFADTQNTFCAHAANAFTNEAFAAAIASHNRQTLIVAGYAAEVALLHTVHAAPSGGYRVHVPVDATGSTSSRTEGAVLQQIEAAAIHVTATSSVLSASHRTSPRQMAKPSLH